jgi:hypothetical protein
MGHAIFPNCLAFINRRQASQRELDESLIGLGTHSQIEMPVFGVNLLITICDQLRPFL